MQQHIVQALFKDKRRLRNVWCKVFLNLLIYAKERWLKIQKELSKEIADAEAAVAAANAACAEDDDGIGESEMQEARERLEQAQAAHAEAQTDLSNLSPLDLAAPTTEETDDAAGLPPGLDLPSSLVTPETLLVGDEAEDDGSHCTCQTDQGGEMAGCDGSDCPGWLVSSSMPAARGCQCLQCCCCLRRNVAVPLVRGSCRYCRRRRHAAR